MPGLVPGAHALLAAHKNDMGGRNKPGPDVLRPARMTALENLQPPARKDQSPPDLRYFSKTRN
jgi:hypothetical protein